MNCAEWPDALRKDVLAGISTPQVGMQLYEDTCFPSKKQLMQPYGSSTVAQLPPSTYACSEETSDILNIMLQAFEYWRQDGAPLLRLGDYTWRRYSAEVNDVRITASVLTITQITAESSPLSVDVDQVREMKRSGSLMQLRLQSPIPFVDIPLRIPTPLPALEEVSSKRRLNSHSLAAQVLYRVKNYKPELVEQFLKILPKCELHNHLTPDPDDNLQYAKSLGLYFDLNDKRFIKERREGCIAAGNLALDEFADTLRKYYNAVRLPKKQWTSKQTTKFFKAFKTIFSTHIPLEMQLAAEIKKAMQNNICYLELMVDLKPKEDPDLTGFNIDDLQGSLEKLMPWCIAYANHWSGELNRIGESVGKSLGWTEPLFSTENPVYVAFLAEVMRTPSIQATDPSKMLATFFADAAASMFLAKADPSRVVGINIAGPEHNPLARELFRKEMEILDFLYSALGQPNIALHAGELTREIASTVDMQDRIKISIDKGHAKRIGHGTCVCQSGDPLSLFEDMKTHKIPVEICFASSSLIHGVEAPNHPFKHYFNKNVPIVLGTDDPNILNTDLTLEFCTAFRHFDCSYNDLKTWVRNSLEFSFLPGESIFTETDRSYTLSDEFSYLEFDGLASHAAKAIMQRSLKARMQVKLELELNKYESKVFKLWQEWSDSENTDTAEPILELAEPHVFGQHKIIQERTPIAPLTKAN